MQVSSLFELIKFIEREILSSPGLITVEEVQKILNQGGYNKEQLYRTLKRVLMRVLTKEGLPALEEDFIEKECHKWVYNQTI